MPGVERPCAQGYEEAMSKPGDTRDEPGLDQAFFETDDPELRAFAGRQTGRKVALLALMLVAIFGAGGLLGWAIYHAVR